MSPSKNTLWAPPNLKVCIRPWISRTDKTYFCPSLSNEDKLTRSIWCLSIGRLALIDLGNGLFTNKGLSSEMSLDKLIWDCTSLSFTPEKYCPMALHRMRAPEPLKLDTKWVYMSKNILLWIAILPLEHNSNDFVLVRGFQMWSKESFHLCIFS